ncbi:protein of unknown function [Pararobbsia alpina]
MTTSFRLIAVYAETEIQSLARRHAAALPYPTFSTSSLARFVNIALAMMSKR